MSTENNKDFQWTDALVKEFMLYYSNIDYVVTGEDPILQEAQKFKQMKGEKRSPEYEILSRRYIKSGEVVPEKTYRLFVEKYYNDPDRYTIHSVRRLSDGEVFSVGETVYRIDGLYSVTIIEFYQPPSKRGEMWFYWSSFKETVKNLDNFKKQDSLISPPKKPLFTTEDGVDLFSISDTVYGVCPKGTWETRELGLLLEPNKTNWKWFAIPYNRDRYILLNKPTLSVSDVMDLYQNHSENFETFLSAVSEAAKAKL